MSIGLMTGAALEALKRLHGVAWQMDLQTLYAPLSEALVWTTAIADFYDRIEEPPYSGIAYARNCVLHGVQVVTFIEQLGPLEQSSLISSVHRTHGGGYSKRWGFGLDPQPHDPTTGPERNQKRRSAYNETVAGHDIQLLDSALFGLGVDLSGLAETPLTPRRS